MWPDTSVFQQVADTPARLGLGPSLLTSVVSAVLGVIGGFGAAYMSTKGKNFATTQDFRRALAQIEENTRAVGDVKALIARREAVHSDLRDAIRRFTLAAGSLVHSMCWLTWDATARHRLNSKLAKRYDVEAHTFLPRLTGYLAVVAAVGSPMLEKLSRVADRVYALDVDIGNAVVLYESHPGKGLTRFTELQAASVKLETDLRSWVADSLASTVKKQ